MLHDLTSISPGGAWPPRGTAKAHERFQANRRLFNGQHDEVFKEAVARRIYREETREAVYFVLNYPKRLSTHWADMLFTETPVITDEGNQEALDELIERSRFLTEAYEATLDVSRFGCGLFKAYLGEDGAIVESVSPEAWHPVTLRSSHRTVTAHVLAYTVVEQGVTQWDEDREYVRLEIHERGTIRHRLHEIKDGKLGEALDPTSLFPELAPVGTFDGLEITEETGVSEFLVVPAFGLRTSDSFYGQDDYSDLESVISELEVRFSQIARILDKHSDPNMYGDEAALETDEETGETSFRGGGKFFPVSKDGVPPAYVTWDGELQANFTAIDKLMEQFFFTAETSPAAFGLMKEGLVESGSALKRLLINDVLKAGRMAGWLQPAMTQALKVAGMLENRDYDPAIQWRDGIPNDERETAEVNAQLVSAGLRSRFLAVKMVNGLTRDEDVEDEIRQIDSEKAAQVEPEPVAEPEPA